MRLSITATMIVTSLAGASSPLHAQDPKPAVDVTAAQLKSFIDNLPQDRITDLPIRVVDVGNGRVGVYGVFRPKAQHGDATRHQTTVTEVYYMLQGSGTLVTGGKIVNELSTGTSPNTGSLNFGGPSIEGGVTRHAAVGDVIVIPPNTPHWWSSLDSDVRYLIIRPDPQGVQAIK